MPTHDELRALAAVPRIADALETIAERLPEPPEADAPFGVLELALLKTCIDKELMHCEEERDATADDNPEHAGWVERVEMLTALLAKVEEQLPTAH